MTALYVNSIHGVLKAAMFVGMPKGLMSVHVFMPTQYYPVVGVAVVSIIVPVPVIVCYRFVLVDMLVRFSR